MQKLTTMAWSKDQIGRRKSARHGHYIARNYFRFRYETIEEVEKKFNKTGDVLSGLTVVDEEGATEPELVWHVHGKRGHRQQFWC